MAEPPPFQSMETCPIPLRQAMREGLWRMILRIHHGLPGFPETGEITENQFTGGVSTVRTGWPLVENWTKLIDAVPIAGFYLFGTFWPDIFRTMELPDNSSKIVASLEKEFGRIPPHKLRFRRSYRPQER